LEPALTPWEVQGGKELEPPLASGAVALIEARWLIALAEGGGVLPSRQALPPEALLTLLQLQASAGLEAQLPIVCISHPWLTEEHPDPDGVYLRKAGRALRLLVDNDPLNGSHAVFHAFCSLHQPCRDEDGLPRPTTVLPAGAGDNREGSGGCGGEGAGSGGDGGGPVLAGSGGFAAGAVCRRAREGALFSEAAKWTGAFLSHPRTLVFLMPDAPVGSMQRGEAPTPAGDLPDTASVSSVNFGQGWCAFESALAFLVKETSMVLDLSVAAADLSPPADPVEALRDLPSRDSYAATVRSLATEPELTKLAGDIAKVVATDHEARRV
jgi:hypothetical protein